MYLFDYAILPTMITRVITCFVQVNHLLLSTSYEKTAGELTIELNPGIKFDFRTFDSLYVGSFNSLN